MNTGKGNSVLTLHLKGRIDSGNAPALERELAEAAASAPDAELELDAEKLEYISSAVLRVLMKARKQMKRPLRVLNVSPEVYEIFDVTGYTGILDVQKKLRRVSVEGCELIGSGGFGKVYRLDAKTIVRFYRPEISLEMVCDERNAARRAFLLGVPTAISCDVVRSMPPMEDCKGVVYELLNARTVAQIMSDNPSLVREMGIRCAVLLRRLHRIVVDKGYFPDRKATLLDWTGRLAPMLTDEEAGEMRDFIRAVPDRRTFLHGDFNAKSIMVQDGQFQLIDMGDAACGHPVFDVAALLLPCDTLPRSAARSEEEKRRLLGFRLEDAPLYWRTMCGVYFGTDSDEAIDNVTRALTPYAQLMASYQSSRLMGFDEEAMARRVLPGIRERLLPLIRAAEPLNW